MYMNMLSNPVIDMGWMRSSQPHQKNKCAATLNQIAILNTHNK
jgi:hypothetical protein